MVAKQRGFFAKYSLADFMEDSMPDNITFMQLQDLLEGKQGAALGFHASKLALGSTPVVRASDLPQPLGVIRQASVHLEMPESRSARNAMVQKGDVVLVARGATHRVGLVGSEVAGAVIANNLIRLRPALPSAGPHILGPVLAAFLESRAGKHQLSRISRSSTAIMSLRVKDLLRMPVPVPPPSRQEIMATLVLAASEHLDAAVGAATARRELAMQSVYGMLMDQGVAS